MAKTLREPPWWLADQTEICPACSQAYAYHTEVRCFDCDSKLCPICVTVTTTMGLACAECVECKDEERN